MYQKSPPRVLTVFPQMSNVARVLPFETLLETGGTGLWRSSKATQARRRQLMLQRGLSSRVPGNTGLWKA